MKYERVEWFIWFTIIRPIESVAGFYERGNEPSSSVRARAHQGNWQPQRNSNFRELLSAWIEHMLLNGAAQIEETATRLTERLRNSTSRQRSMPVFSQMRCRVVS
jgi:hypothetical protein